MGLVPLPREKPRFITFALNTIELADSMVASGWRLIAELKVFIMTSDSFKAAMRPFLAV
jgi:hypothetical protein